MQSVKTQVSPLVEAREDIEGEDDVDERHEGGRDHKEAVSSDEFFLQDTPPPSEDYERADGEEMVDAEERAHDPVRCGQDVSLKVRVRDVGRIRHVVVGLAR